MTRARLAAAVAVTALALTTTGCTVGTPKQKSSASTSPVISATPSASVSATPSETPTPTPTMTGTPTLGTTLAPAATGSASTTLGGTPGATPTPLAMPSGPATPSLLTTTPGGTLGLGTGNAFRADGWTVGVFAPAAAPTTKVPSLAATVNCNSAPVELEYRFANSAGTLNIVASQEVMSASADNTIDVSIVTDGKAVVEKTATFKQSVPLSAPLQGVTVAKVVVKSTGNCTASTTALLTSANVTG